MSSPPPPEGLLRRLQHPFRAAREEVRIFREAYRAAPEPELTRDLWGMRRATHKVLPLLLSEHTSPARLGFAVLVGVVIGCSPFYGFHFVLCVLFALVLGLNKLTVWLGANISLPFFAPFIGFASIQAGHYLLRGAPLGREALALGERSPTELAAEFFGLWALGGLPVGLLLGALLGGTVWRLAELRSTAGPA